MPDRACPRQRACPERKPGKECDAFLLAELEHAGLHRVDPRVDPIPRPALALGVLHEGPHAPVLVEGHGMSPKEMETQVTFPIEAAVNGAPDVRRVRSGTAVGIAVVWVEFEWGPDIYRARQTVAERLAAVAGSLPPQVEPPKLAPASSIMGEILFVANHAFDCVGCTCLDTCNVVSFDYSDIHLGADCNSHYHSFLVAKAACCLYK